MRGFVVELSDGSSFSEENLMSALKLHVDAYGMPNARPWVFLKEYLRRRKLQIVSLKLKFDNQEIFLPRHSPAYFYSLKVEGYLGVDSPNKLYYGVGAAERLHDQVEITWYDGFNSIIETRKVEKNNAAFITNSIQYSI